MKEERRKISNFSIKPGKDDFFENCHFQNPVQMTDSHFHSFVYPELLRSYKNQRKRKSRKKERIFLPQINAD